MVSLPVNGATNRRWRSPGAGHIRRRPPRSRGPAGWRCAGRGPGVRPPRRNPGGIGSARPAGWTAGPGRLLEGMAVLHCAVSASAVIGFAPGTLLAKQAQGGVDAPLDALAASFFDGAAQLGEGGEGDRAFATGPIFERGLAEVQAQRALEFTQGVVGVFVDPVTAVLHALNLVWLRAGPFRGPWIK